MTKERLLSSIQYATGWLLTFFTHAAIGVRSTALRYHIWRRWVDWVFLAVWLIACAAFVIIWRNG